MAPWDWRRAMSQRVDVESDSDQRHPLPDSSSPLDWLWLGTPRWLAGPRSSAGPTLRWRCWSVVHPYGPDTMAAALATAPPDHQPETLIDATAAATTNQPPKSPLANEWLWHIPWPAIGKPIKADQSTASLHIFWQIRQLAAGRRR